MIETNIKHVAGVDDYGYGLTWSIKDVDNYYAFEISANGYYRISKTIEGEWSAIRDWTENSLINTYMSNKLAVQKDGDQLKFFLNDSYLDQIPFVPFIDYGVGYVIWRDQTIEVDDLRVRGTYYLDYDELLDEMIDEMFGDE